MLIRMARRRERRGVGSRSTSMIVGVAKETAAGETRVALTPASAAQLIRANAIVMVESGAGAAAGFEDAAFVGKGVKVAGRDEVLASVDVLLQVRCLRANDGNLARVKAGALLVGFC